MARNENITNGADVPGSFEYERRRRQTRRITCPARSDLASGWTGQLTAGAVRTTTPPFMVLRTVTAGVDKIAEASEDPGSSGASIGDPWADPATPGGFWAREHYSACMIAQNAADPPVNPTDTMYTCFEVVSMFAAPPFNLPPTPNSTQQVVQIRARLSDGRWEVYTDNSAASRIDVLTGVTPFLPGNVGTPERFSGFRVELRFQAGQFLRAWVNGVLGLNLGPEDMILDDGSQGIIFPSWPNQGMGCYVTSGTDVAAHNSALFTDLIDETIGHL